MNLSTMRLKPEGASERELIEMRHACESCGIMITALILETDLAGRYPVMYDRAMAAIQEINKIAELVNKKL